MRRVALGAVEERGGMTHSSGRGERTTMPQGAPASLSPSGYAAISAYLLAKNEVPAGDTELPSDTDDLEGITITEPAQ